MQVVLTAILDTYKKLKDGSMKVTFETGELWAEQVLGIHELCNQEIYIAMWQNPLAYQDIQDNLPKALEQTPKRKSSSKRLRSVLYLLRKKWGKGDKDDYYEKMMDSIIEFYKGKLDEW
jgi:hypothetical protein